MEGFLNNLPPHFFICLYFIGEGGDENLKKFLAWPKSMLTINYSTRLNRNQKTKLTLKVFYFFIGACGLIRLNRVGNIWASK